MSTTQLTHYQPFLSVTPPKSAVSDRYDRKIADSRAVGFRFIGFTGARIQIHRIHSRLDSDSQDSQPAGVGFRILAGGLLPRLGMPRRRPLESWASSGILGPRIDRSDRPPNASRIDSFLRSEMHVLKIFLKIVALCSTFGHAAGGCAITPSGIGHVDIPSSYTEIASVRRQPSLTRSTLGSIVGDSIGTVRAFASARVPG